MRIREVIRRKGDQVVTIRSDADVTTLLALLAEHGIGAVVVSDDEGASLSGIVSERDVVRRLHSDGPGALSLPVAELMTADVHTCVPDDALEELAQRMTDHRVRHLPVLQEGRLTAIVSIGDIVKHRIDELQEEREQLVNYIQR